MDDKPAYAEKPLTPASKRFGVPVDNVVFPLPRWLMFTGVILVALVILDLWLAGYVEKWLWMREIDYVGIFWTLLSVQCAIGGVAFIFAFGFLWVNLRRAVQNSTAFRAEAISPFWDAFRPKSAQIALSQSPTLWVFR